MKRLGISVAALVAAIAMIAVVVPSGIASRGGVKVIAGAFITTSLHVVDSPPKMTSRTDFSTGDVVVFEDQFVSHRRLIGHNHGACTTTTFPKFLCQTTLELRGGDLLLAGYYDIVTSAVQRLSIVGGTGHYRDARGEITNKNSSDTRTDVVLTIIP